MQEFYSYDANMPNGEMRVTDGAYSGSGAPVSGPFVPPSNLPESHVWKQDLRRLSRAGGGALLLFCALQLALVIMLHLLENPAALLVKRFLPGVDANTAELFWNGFASVLMGLLVIMPGVLLGLRLLSPEDNNISLPFRRPANHPPVSKATIMKVVIAGAFLCLMGNFAATIFSSIANMLGYDFVAPENPASETTAGLLFMTFASAVMPGICEELLMRGMIMQPLRRYGDRFALVASALLFAILHQNMVQAPMAFCAGLALGWATMKTGTLWAAIFIHIWNNAVSTILLALEKPLGDSANYVFWLYVPLLAMAGMFCLISLARESGGGPPKVKHPLSAGTRAINYFFGSPAMGVALIYLFYMLARGIQATA